MPILGSTTKQPNEVEKYAISYAQDVGPTDFIQVLGIFIEDLEGNVTGLPVVDSYIPDNETKQVKMFISGGTAGCVYKVTTRVQLDSGRVLEDEFKLRIKDY